MGIFCSLPVYGNNVFAGYLKLKFPVAFPKTIFISIIGIKIEKFNILITKLGAGITVPGLAICI